VPKVIEGWGPESTGASMQSPIAVQTQSQHKLVSTLLSCLTSALHPIHTYDADAS